MKWRSGGTRWQGWGSGLVLVALAVVTVVLVALAWKNAHPPQPRKAGAFHSQLPTSPSPSTSPSSSPTTTDLSLPDGKFTVEVVGGAITQGQGASSTRKAYPALLQTALDADGRKASTQVVPASLDDPQQVKQAVSDAGPAGLVVVELGSEQVGVTDATKLKGGYRGILTAIRTQSPDAALICLGVWAPSDAASPYDKLVANACQRAGGRFITLSDLADRTDSADKGSAVPNDTGQAQLVDRILSAIDVPIPSNG